VVALIGGALIWVIGIIAAISLLDPVRTVSAGTGLRSFAGGFREILITPLAPIGALGGELSGLGRGFEEFAGAVGAGFSGITNPVMDFLTWASELFGGYTGYTAPISTLTSPPAGQPIPLNHGEVISLALASGIDPAGKTIGELRGMLADWADTPNTQFLEGVLLNSGWQHG
tara:strand:+ start:2801 stop:3316 length:516 start_codon:yes stop_codon:yes gene_type:complete